MDVVVQFGFSTTEEREAEDVTGERVLTLQQFGCFQEREAHTAVLKSMMSENDTSNDEMSAVRV